MSNPRFLEGSLRSRPPVYLLLQRSCDIFALVLQTVERTSVLTMAHYSTANAKELVKFLLASPIFQTNSSAERTRMVEDVNNWSEDERKWFVSAPQQRGGAFVLAKLQSPSFVKMIMVGCQDRFSCYQTCCISHAADIRLQLRDGNDAAAGAPSDA